MAPAGGFWAAAGAWVVFGCARGKSGEVMVLLGAKEEEKELGCGRNVGGGQLVDGGELRRARGFWPFKANQGRRGRWFGGRWRAALMAGRGQRLRQRHGRAHWVPRRRRGASSSSCRLWRARRLSGTRQARRDGGGGGQRRACGQGAHGQAASGRAVEQRAHAGRA